MAGTSIKLCFRFCHADIEAGRFLHCHHHRWLWLASHDAVLVISICPCVGIIKKSTYERERWYATKCKTPNAEQASISNWPDYLEYE
jgi:hypothetical protein